MLNGVRRPSRRVETAEVLEREVDDVAGLMDA
jgi:hypothetical protein